jgi:putative hydrolase of the HAD superfamily
MGLAIERLKLPAEAIGFVGDSYERDILPAKSLGMKTFWMIGDNDLCPRDPSKVDHLLRSLADLPHEIKPYQKVI